MTTKAEIPKKDPEAEEQKERPVWVNTDLTNRVTVYAHTLAALIRTDGSRVHDLWMELVPKARERRHVRLGEMMEEVAQEFAERSEIAIFDVFMKECTF